MASVLIPAGKLYAPRPLLVELAGPAGAGKSSLSTALVRRVDGKPGAIWGQPVIPLLVNGAQLMPTFGPLWLQSKSLLWDETRHMVRLQTLQRSLRQGESLSQGALIFDEGPVFAMAWLRGFGHQVLRAQPSAEWWQAALAEWASLIDAVVVLDAPDRLLARRIRTRPHEHEVKDFPDHDIVCWMARFREALEWVLTEMTRRGGPVVIRFSSEDQSADCIAEKLKDELSGRRRVC
jgi:hypothetical protein